jgi:hypothetical protein
MYLEDSYTESLFASRQLNEFTESLKTGQIILREFFGSGPGWLLNSEQVCAYFFSHGLLYAEAVTILASKGPPSLDSAIKIDDNFWSFSHGL